MEKKTATYNLGASASHFWKPIWGRNWMWTQTCL